MSCPPLTRVELDTQGPCRCGRPTCDGQRSITQLCHPHAPAVVGYGGGRLSLICVACNTVYATVQVASAVPS